MPDWRLHSWMEVMSQKYASLYNKLRIHELSFHPLNRGKINILMQKVWEHMTKEERKEANSKYII